MADLLFYIERKGAAQVRVDGAMILERVMDYLLFRHPEETLEDMNVAWHARETVAQLLGIFSGERNIKSNRT